MRVGLKIQAQVLGTLIAVELLVILGALPVGHAVQISPRLVENSSVPSPASYPWWWSQPTTVTQQWGCTSNQFEGTLIPPGYHCPPAPYNHWHHGIDFADGSGQQAVNCLAPTNGNPTGAGYNLYAGRYGTVTKIDIPHPQPDNYVSDLQIQMIDGYYVNLLHVQSTLSGIGVGSPVVPGEGIATVGNYGYPTWSYGCHLHFEIDQTNVLGDNGGYDVDPTKWLSSNACLGAGFAPGTHTQVAVTFIGSQAHVFIRGLDGSLYHQTYANPSTSWDCFGGFIQGSPAAVYDNKVSPYQVYVIARWADGTARYAGWSGSGSCCSNWASLGSPGAVTSDPVAVLDNNNKLHVLVRGSDSNIYDDYMDTSGNWSGWNTFDASSINAVGQPAVVATNNHLYVFIRKPDNSLWWDSKDLTTLGTTGWVALNGSAVSDPVANVDGSRLQLVIYGLDSQLWRNSFDLNSQTWGGWFGIGGHLIGDPNTLEEPSPQFDIFVHGVDSPTNALWEYVGVWGSLGYGNSGGVTNNPMGAFINSRVHVFVRGSDGALWEAVNDASPWSWYGHGGQIS